MSLWQQMFPRCGGGKFEPPGHGWQNIRSEPVTMHCYILTIEAVGFMVVEKVF